MSLSKISGHPESFQQIPVSPSSLTEAAVLADTASDVWGMLKYAQIRTRCLCHLQLVITKKEYKKKAGNLSSTGMPYTF